MLIYLHISLFIETEDKGIQASYTWWLSIVIQRGSHLQTFYKRKEKVEKEKQKGEIIPGFVP